jgi:hypothetical protein
MVLVMTVEPGFGGQSFMPEMMPKLKAIREECKAKKLDINLQVDGGIAEKTVALAAANGANVSAVAEKKTVVDTELETLGRTWKKYIENSTADVYKITYTINDFGMFANGYDDVDTSYFALYDMTLGYALSAENGEKILNTVVPTADNVASVASLASTLPDGTKIVPSFGENNTEGVLSLYFQPSSNNSAGQVWPKANNVVNSGDFKIVVFVAVEVGANITLTPSANTSYKKMNYAIGSKQYDITAAIWTNTNITMSNLVIGSTTTKEFEKVTGEQSVAGTRAEEGKYEGKYLKHIATVLENSALSKYISISDGTETRVSTRTVAEILGGISVDNTSVSGKLAIGVLTANPDAVFTFDLVAPAAE